jgi:tetratricopeptide (TPR) repeat protein
VSSEMLEPKDSDSRSEQAADGDESALVGGTEHTEYLDEGETGTPELEAADEALERRLSEPVLKGEQGIEDAQVWIAAFLLVMAGVVAYSNVFTGPFHSEDVRVIQTNTAAHALLDLPRAFVDGAPGALTMASFALNWGMTPNNATGFHVINVLLHVLNGALVFFTCRRLLQRDTHIVLPLLGALLFTLHPLATESTNYIVGRESLLIVTFTMSALLLYLRATETQESPDWVLLTWSLVCAFLAWSSGATGIVAPVLVLLVERVRLDGRSGATPWSCRLPYAALFGAGLAYEFAVRSHSTGMEEHSAFSIVLTAGVALVRSLQLTLLPLGLTIEHGLAVVPEGMERSAIPSLALALVVGVAGCALWWNRTLLGLGILWLIVSCIAAFAFASSSQIYTERHSYLAVAGVAFVIPWVVQYARQYQNGYRTSTIAVAVIALALGVLSFQRNQLWGDEVAVWADARDKSPNSQRVLKWIAHHEVVLGQQGEMESKTLEQQRQLNPAAEKLEEALSNYRQAEDTLKEVLEEYPDDAEAYADYGYALRGLGRRDEAIAALMNALRLKPEDQEITFNLALLWEWKYDTSERKPSDLANAIDYYRRAERLGPLTDEAMIAYGIALGRANKWEEAASKLHDIVEKYPQSPVTQHYNRSLQQIALEKQLEQFLTSLSIEDMEKTESLAKAADLLIVRGMPLGASYVYSSLLEKDPGNLRLWLGLGRARARMGMTDIFVNEFPNAPAVEPTAESPWLQLARACVLDNHVKQAEEYLDSAPAQAQGIGPALLRLSDIAESLNDPSSANRFLRDAAKKYPNDPAPLLRMTDKAIAANDLASARMLLNEAERRGASAAEVETRRAKIGTEPAGEQKEAPKEQEFVLQ